MFKILTILVILFCLKAFSIDKTDKRKQQELADSGPGRIQIQNDLEEMP